MKAKHTVKAAVSVVDETRTGRRSNVVLPTGQPNLPVCAIGPCGTDTGRSKHRYRVTARYWEDGRATDICSEVTLSLHVEKPSSSFYNWGMAEAAEFQDTLQKYNTLTDFMSSQKKPPNFILIILAASESVGLRITDICCSNLMLIPFWTLTFINWRLFVIRVKERDGAFHSRRQTRGRHALGGIQQVPRADTIHSHTPRGNVPSAVTKWEEKKRERNKNPFWWLFL